MAPLAQTLGPCLVTGGGGFLGTEIVRQLREAGCPVTSASRRRYPHVEALGATCAELDVRDAEAVRRAVDGHRTVFHVAAVPGAFGPRERYWSANFEGTRHVLRAAVDAG
ncbi:MAG: NAD-dependent epimerase/dehydratase family protein, partial [Planctomycetota bacterium]